MIQETLDWCNNVLELRHLHVPNIFPNFIYKTSLSYRQCDNQMSLASLSCFVRKFCSFKIIVSLLDYTRTHYYVDVSYTMRHKEPKETNAKLFVDTDIHNLLLRNLRMVLVLSFNLVGIFRN